jgi:hypothetical protein
MSTPIQTHRRPRRFRTPESKDAIPDSIRQDDGSLIINPEWEAAIYEETFFLNGRQLPPMNLSELNRKISSDSRATK